MHGEAGVVQCCGAVCSFKFARVRSVLVRTPLCVHILKLYGDHSSKETVP